MRAGVVPRAQKLLLSADSATLASNSTFVDAKYAAIAEFDAATYDASTDAGAAALAALADYRSASKALELEQFARNLSDSADLTGGIVTRMQAYVDDLATLSSEADITAARDAYYADLGAFYTASFTATGDYLKDYYDAVTAAEVAFTALTGDSPTHPEYYPWWWSGGDGDPRIIIDPPIDPLPPVPGEGPGPADGSDSSDSGDSGDSVDSGSGDSGSDDGAGQDSEDGSISPDDSATSGE